jgi:hypothetical protein
VTVKDVVVCFSSVAVPARVTLYILPADAWGQTGPAC